MLILAGMLPEAQPALLKSVHDILHNSNPQADLMRAPASLPQSSLLQQSVLCFTSHYEYGLSM